jgi:NDP-sugar pyrophosphorylase family protein
MNFADIRKNNNPIEEIYDYDFSKIPVVIFAGGKGRRMKTIYPLSKEWFLIFSQNHELKLEPLFWSNFEILLELGFKEFYFIVTKKGEEAKEYFEEEFKGKNANVQLLNKENFSRKIKAEGINIYIFEQKTEGTGNALVEIKEAIDKRPFLELFGDEYFGGEKESVKKELIDFINFAIKKIKQNNALKVEAFVKKERAISNVNDEERKYCLKKDGQLGTIENSNLVVTSLSLSSFEIIDIFEKKGIKDFNTFEIQQELIKTGKVYGKIVDLIFANINTKEDYIALLVYITNTIIQNKNNKLLKLR